MFDMQRVSKTISALRKERNLTQMELADRLNISFQAVSNWERGQTMPDIAKLGELADIFGVTIDELLGNGENARIAETLLNGEPLPEEISAEDFLDIAPLVKPRQAEKLWESVKGSPTLKELILAAPFLSESVLDAFAVRAVERERSFEGMTGLLPFISRDAISRCMAFVTVDGVNIKKIIWAAPFLGKKNLNLLADQILREGNIKDLVALAPFLGRKKLTEAAACFLQKDGFAKILPLLPFLDKEVLEGYFTGDRETE
jgi:transcriptional regulator with XRE-family HTH domain